MLAETQAISSWLLPTEAPTVRLRNMPGHPKPDYYPVTLPSLSSFRHPACAFSLKVNAYEKFKE